MKKTNYYTEQELVCLLKQHDPAAFSFLYDQYAPSLNGVILKLIRSKAQTEDILQEVFVKIWNNFNTYDEQKGKLFTWMINVTRNCTIDFMRTKGYKTSSRVCSNELCLENLLDPSFQVKRFDSLGLKKIIRHLKDDQQLIVELAYFQGYTQNEIASELRIPLGTVKSKLRAAIIELRKHFKVTELKGITQPHSFEKDFTIDFSQSETSKNLLASIRPAA